jgi:hypothetical protein
VFVHPNHIWAVHDPRIHRECAACKLEQERLITNEDQLVMRMFTCPSDAAWNNFCGTVVAAHCIECKADAA